MVHSPYRFIAGVLACIALFTGSAQQIVPSMVWESLYRDSICRAAAVVQTADGGYMLGGNAYVTNELRGEDCILIKINSQGEVEWKKTYGGTGFDAIRSVRQTTDGGYVFAATSSSPPSGNKEAAKFGSEDAWIVKVDAVGNKQWEKSFGGTEGRFCLCNPANDGRWIYFRRDYSTPSAEDQEGWLIKLDAQGSTEWERLFGRESNDIFNGICEMSDGSYLFSKYIVVATFAKR